MHPPAFEPRAHCLRCDRPASMCLCDVVPRLLNTVPVHVLQHHRERRHPIGTTRLLRLGLSRCELHLLPCTGRSAATAPIPLPPDAALLYPSPGAPTLEDLPPEHRPRQLVVIDGTWSHAHRIHRDNPWIAALPHVSLHPPEPSRYRIRAEPRHECLSTVEAVVAALRVLEPDLAGTDALLAAFDAMIDRQIQAAAQRPKQPRHRAPRHPHPPAPTPDRLVAVYAEAAPDPSTWHDRYEALRVSACTLRDGAIFDQLLQTREPPDAWLIDRMDLTDGQLAQAQPAEQARAALRDFCGPDPVTFVAWGNWTHRLLRAWFPDDQHRLLKAEWANQGRGPAPSLDAMLDTVDDPQPPLPGRAGRRLLATRVMAERLLTTR